MHVGEVFAATDRISKAVLYFAQNVELVPPEHRTIKLFRDDEANLLGFASWQLRESDGLTTVVYDVAGGSGTPGPSVATGALQFSLYERFEQEGRMIGIESAFEIDFGFLQGGSRTRCVSGLRPRESFGQSNLCQQH